MALWKPFRGNRADLDVVEKHDGYVYFCTDDGSLFFDYTDADGNLQRKQISTADAEKANYKVFDNEIDLNQAFEPGLYVIRLNKTTNKPDLSDIQLNTNYAFLKVSPYSSWYDEQSEATIREGITQELTVFGYDDSVDWVVYSCVYTRAVYEDPSTPGYFMDDGWCKVGDSRYGNKIDSFNDSLLELSTSLSYYPIPAIPTNSALFQFYSISNDTAYEISQSEEVSEELKNLTTIVVPYEYNGKPVTTIGTLTFDNCVNLKTIILPNTITSIQSDAFVGNHKLSSIMSKDFSNISIDGMSPFYGCNFITDISQLIKCKSHGEGDFAGMNGITDVDLTGYSSKIIGMDLFSSCSNLTTIKIPKTITHIADYAFAGCNKLTTVYYEGSKEEWENIQIDNMENENAPLLNANIIYNAIFNEFQGNTKIDGYLEAKNFSYLGGVDLNTILEPGLYTINLHNCTNKPELPEDFNYTANAYGNATLIVSPQGIIVENEEYYLSQFITTSMYHQEDDSYEVLQYMRELECYPPGGGLISQGTWVKFADSVGSNDIDLSNYVQKEEGKGLSSVQNIYSFTQLASDGTPYTEFGCIKQDGSDTQLNLYSKEQMDSKLAEIDSMMLETIVTSITNNHLVLEHNQDARLGTLSILTVSLPSEIVDNYKSYLCFTSSETPMAFACNSDIIWMGDDVNEEGVFTPDVDTMYEVSIRKINETADGTPIIVARTGMTSNQYTDKDNGGIEPPASGDGESIYYTHIFQNLLNPDEIESGYIDPASGKIYTHATYKTTGYIAVKPGDLVGMSINNSQNQNSPLKINFAACYDINKQVIKNALPSGTKLQFIVPNNVYFVRVSYVGNAKPVSFEILNEMGNAPYYLNYGESIEHKILKSELGIRFFLPEKLYVYTNSIFDIYYPAMFASTHTGYNVELNYQPASAVLTLKSTDRKLVITTNGTGTFDLAINVVNSKGERIASKRFQIVVKAKSTATKTIAPIGDSLTNAKPWEAEVIRLNNNFSLVGCKSNQQQDSAGTMRTFGHCGFSGWTSGNYYKQAVVGSETNPFWDASINDGAGGFSWGYYVTNSLGGSTPDVVNFFLGMNDITYPNLDERIGWIKAMIDDILNTSPNIKIILCTPQYRDYKYGADAISGAYNFMVKMYDIFKTYSNIIFVPLGLYHDSEYNYMDGSKIVVNPRSDFQIDGVTDVTHPQKPGYWQIADAIFSALCAI